MILYPNITNISYLFCKCKSLTSLSDLYNKIEIEDEGYDNFKDDEKNFYEEFDNTIDSFNEDNYINIY